MVAHRRASRPPSIRTSRLLCRFRQLGREEVGIVRAGLGVDGDQVGLCFARVVERETQGHVDEEDGGGCQGCERDGAVCGFGFGDLWP